MAVADSEYKFILYDVGCNGRVNDKGVFRESNIAGYMGKTSSSLGTKNLPGSHVELPYVFIGDDAFPLKPHLLKPYSSRDKTMECRIYNYRLSRARRIIENAFSILANRFQTLQTKINLNVEKVELITVTTLALHNYLITEAKSSYLQVDIEDTENVNIDLAGWRSCRNILGLPSCKINRSRNDSQEIRNKFKTFFNN